MSIYLGTSLLAGVATNTISNSNSLLDFKWTDHILNEMSWLRSDTFSWQSGAVYTSVYNHLVADNSSGTSQTETIGSYTITYTLATDGHKITTDEATVSQIYAESGVAWFYVLDTANQRFKLPRSLHGDIVEKYVSGNDWYRVYSDGWCEQGGFSSGDGWRTITLIKTFSNTNYSVQLTGATTSRDGSSGLAHMSSNLTEKTTSSIRVSGWGLGVTNGGIYWEAYGYLSTTPTNSQYKYLYFYVGDFSQSATEQTAGLNSELFNSKLDTDLANMTPTSDVKKTFVRWGVPDFDAGVSISTTYTPTVDGIITAQRNAGYSTAEIKITSSNIVIARHASADSSSSNSTVWAIVKAGVSYTLTSGTNTFYPFIGA